RTRPAGEVGPAAAAEIGRGLARAREQARPTERPAPAAEATARLLLVVELVAECAVADRVGRVGGPGGIVAAPTGRTLVDDVRRLRVLEVDGADLPLIVNGLGQE